jgi:hypothetical protein
MGKLEKIFLVLLLGWVFAFILNFFLFGFQFLYIFIFFGTIGCYLIIKLIKSIFNIKKSKKKEVSKKSKNFLIGLGVFIISILIVRNISFAVGFIYSTFLCLGIGILIYKKCINRKNKLIKIIYILALIISLVFISSILYSFFCTFFISVPGYEHWSDGSRNYILIKSFGFIPHLTYSYTEIMIGKANGYSCELEYIGIKEKETYCNFKGIFFYSEKEWLEYTDEIVNSK